MPRLVLIRHGESQWNLENRFTGWVDVSITPKGEDEARRAGAELKGLEFAAAFASALRRSQQTLAIILKEIARPQIPIFTDAALNERSYGDLQGLNKKETAEKYGAEQVHLWRRSYDVRPPGGESLKDTAARVLPYFESKILPMIKGGADILVCAHGNSLRALIMRLEGMSPEAITGVNIETCRPIRYEMDGQGRARNRVFS